MDENRQDELNEEVKQEETQQETSVASEIVEVSEETKTEEKEEIVEEVKEPVKEKPLTDDELYAKIETEKMLKAEKKKKIAIASSLGAILALALVFILLAVIPTNFTPAFLKGDNYVAYVHTTSSNNASSGMLSKDTDSEGYNKLKSLMKEAFTQSTLTAMFNGTTGNYIFSETPDGNGIMTKSTFLSKYSSFVRFDFGENEQILKNKNGSNFESARNSRKSFEFTEAYLVLNKEDGLKTADFYVVVTSNNSNPVDYVIKMTTNGNTFVIYDYFAND